MSVGLQEVLEYWSIVDLYEAHAVLNELDRAQAQAAKDARGTP